MRLARVMVTKVEAIGSRHRFLLITRYLPVYDIGCRQGIRVLKAHESGSGAGYVITCRKERPPLVERHQKVYIWSS